MKITKAELIEQNNNLRSALQEQRKLTIHWETKAKERLDVQMLEARMKLANSLGQMIEATSKAVQFIVGKEVM